MKVNGVGMIPSIIENKTCLKPPTSYFWGEYMNQVVGCFCWSRFQVCTSKYTGLVQDSLSSRWLFVTNNGRGANNTMVIKTWESTKMWITPWLKGKHSFLLADKENHGFTSTTGCWFTYPNVKLYSTYHKISHVKSRKYVFETANQGSTLAYCSTRLFGKRNAIQDPVFSFSCFVLFRKNMHIFQIPFIVNPVFWESTIWHHKSGLDPSFARNHRFSWCSPPKKTWISSMRIITYIIPYIIPSLLLGGFNHLETYEFVSWVHYS